MTATARTATHLRAFFAAAVMGGMTLMAAPSMAATLNDQPRVATPEQVQQYNNLETELNSRESAYTLLQQKFDLGQLTAEQYRAAVAALDAGQPKPPTTTTVPNILRPRITGCTSDGYSVNIPINLTIDTKAFDASQTSGAMAMHMMQSLDQALQIMIRNANIRLLATTSHADIETPAFKTAIDAALSRFSTNMSSQLHIGIKATAQDIESASTRNCLIQPNTPAPATPSP